MAEAGITVNPSVLEWAVQESQIDISKLLERFPSFFDWVGGAKKPSFRQLETLSGVLHIPLGTYFWTLHQRSMPLNMNSGQYVMSWSTNPARISKTRYIIWIA